MGQVLVFGDVATGWFVIQEGERGEAVMEGERPGCPQPVCHFPHLPTHPSNPSQPAQHGHTGPAKHAPQPVMLQTYGEAALQ